MTSSALDSQVEPGFSKGSLYEKHRATYASDAVQLLLDNLQVSGKRDARILDLAAGTGKFTEALAAREEQYQIVAVEPLESMRSVLAEKSLLNTEVKDGHAGEIPVEDGSIDAVVIAQAFHWFATLDALKEIHRGLKRHSALGLIWNLEHWNAAKDHQIATSWEKTINDLLFSLAKQDDGPRYRDMQWRKVFDDQIKKNPLSVLIPGDDPLFALPIAETKLEWEITLSKEEAWNRFYTLSHVAVLEGEALERVRQTFMDAINTAETDENGKVTLHGYTHLVWTTKIPADGRSASTDVESQGTE